MKHSFTDWVFHGRCGPLPLVRVTLAIAAALAAPLLTVTPAAAATPCETAPTPIGAVQGATDTSPVAGTTATVRGTVVGDYEGAQPALRGFYLQDAGDGDPATSDGIFVFDSGANVVNPGDVVQVTGPVSEFQGQTQITAAATGIEACGSTGTVTPVDITLPRTAAADLEPYEGMLVRLHQTATVSESFQLGRFGQVVVSNGRLRQPTADIRATDRAAVAAAAAANARNRLIVDDANQAQNPDPIVFGRGGQPLSATNTLRIGDTVSDAVGVLTYTWAGNAASGNAYRLRPVNALGGTASFTPANARPSSPPDVGPAGIKVASANLLNFFTQFTGCTFGVGGAAADCRGANNAAEYQRQLAKEVDSLTFLDADVIGYMEMQNNGYGPDSAVQALVNALNAKEGAGTWAFVDPDAATGVTNAAGTDAIKPGLLYKPAQVTPLTGKTFADDQAGDLFERRPVAQTFATPVGGAVTVVANHFKSKGSCPASGPDTDQGDGQACWNARRTLQAQELARWIGATVVPGAGDPDVLIAGDLNSYAGEDPIAALEAAGYTNLVRKFGGDEAYSYVFDAQTGYLDHMLASSSLVAQVTGTGDAHHNADEPSVLDYNTEFKNAGQVASLYAPDRFRTSDHDPVLTGLALVAPPVLSGTLPGATVGQAYSAAVPFAGTRPATFTAGTLPAGLALSPDGTVSGTPLHVGSTTFTVTATNAAGSAAREYTVAVARGTSTTAVTSSPNPSRLLQAVTFTATITGAGPDPGGTVTFKAGPVPLGRPVAVTGTSARIAVAVLPPGTTTITATWSGTPDATGSAGTVKQVVALPRR
jgi:predicted extracellular nuclease